MTMHAPAADAAFPQDPRPPLDDVPALCDWLERRYIKNDRDAQLQVALSEILQVEKGRLRPVPVRVGIKREARGLLVTAPSGAGKSVLLKRNLARLFGAPCADQPSGGVVAVTVAGEATLKSVGLQICRATGYPEMRDTATKWQIFDVDRHRLGALKFGLLWLDEAHHLFAPRRGGEPAPEVLRMLKSLLQGDSATAVILSGIPDLDELLSRDVETRRRFGRLRLAKVAGPTGRSLVDRSVEAYRTWAGLEGVNDRFLADRLLHATDASFGQAMEMARAAIRQALLGGRSALSLEDFARVFDRFSKPGVMNPFDIVDWEAAMVRHVPRGKSGR